MSTKLFPKTKEELLAEIDLLRQEVANLKKNQTETPSNPRTSLELSSNYFRAIFEQSPFSIQIYGLNGELLEMNEASEKLWGVTYKEIGYYNVFEDNQVEALGIMSLFRRAFSGEMITLPPIFYDPAKTFPGYKGRSRWVEARVCPIKDPEGKVVQIALVHNDITEKKLAEDALQFAYGDLENSVIKRTKELSQANIQLKQQLEELKVAAEEREILQLILENIPLMINYYDENRNFLLVNREWEKTFGWTFERLKREGTEEFLNYIFPDVEERENIYEMMKNPSPNWYDVKVRVANNKILETSWITRKLSNGKTICIGQDITDSRDSEVALQKSEATLRTIIESATDAIFIKDLRGKYLLINSAGARFLGRKVEDVIGKDDSELFSLDTAEEIMAGDRRVMISNQTHSYEDIGTAAGFTRTYLSIKTPYHDSDGNVIGLIGISRDITERKRAEEAIAAEKELLAVTLASINDGVITVDKEGKIILINQSAEQIIGVSQEEAINKPVSKVLKLFSETNRKTRRNTVNKALKTGKRFEHTTASILVTKDGLERIVAESALPIFDTDSKLVGVVLVFRDITEKRKIEEKLMHEQAARAVSKLVELELEKSNLQLQALSAYVLKAQEEERIRLARELHDELGQALTSIRLGLELASASLPEAQVDKTSKILSDLCDYVETTAKDVQRVARDLRPSVLDDFGLSAALEAYADAYAKRTGIRVNLFLDKFLKPLTKEVETAFYRIVQEALNNSAKHSIAKNISIDLTERNTQVVLTIVDDGRGCILDIDQKNSFGLMGMSERARIVGAEISMKSQVGKGFWIQVTLPKGKTGSYEKIKNIIGR
ncbi:MAG: PAS domain S-box protein [Acidobacteria bacterium]|nr:PAS domain S-box protein [Acidobacteriota bacterium]